MRPAGDPLLFGTLKPNIGHVEAASGIAGAIKVVLSPRVAAVERLRTAGRDVTLTEKPALGGGGGGIRGMRGG